MAWTYVDPNNSDRDKVRFLIGDTDTTDQLITDEEVEWLLTEVGGSIYQAAHDGCYAIAAKFSRMATSKSVGDLSLSYADRAAAFREQGDRILELAARREVPTPWIKPDAIKQARERTTTTGTEFAVGGLDNKRY